MPTKKRTKTSSSSSSSVSQQQPPERFVWVEWEMRGPTGGWLVFPREIEKQLEAAFGAGEEDVVEIDMDDCGEISHEITEL